MAGKVEKRKEELRARLIDAAESQIVAGGISSVKARDLAREAGCALGAIYNVFDDLTALIMAVNGRTFQALGQAVAGALADEAPADPNARLICMAQAYLRYASENTHLWRALFDLEMSTDSAVPGWYLEELARLFSYISAPLAEIYPERGADEIELLTRALFSSVHGIVLLGLEKRISGVPVAQIERMIALVLSEIGNR